MKNLGLGFDPVSLMAAARAKGLVQAPDPWQRAVNRKRPELAGLRGPAYNREYSKLRREAWRAEKRRRMEAAIGKPV